MLSSLSSLKKIISFVVLCSFLSWMGTVFVGVVVAGLVAVQDANSFEDVVIHEDFVDGRIFAFNYLLLFTAYIVVKSISKTEQIYHKQTLLCQCEVVIITDRSCGRFWRKVLIFHFFVVFELMTNFLEIRI